MKKIIFTCFVSIACCLLSIESFSQSCSSLNIQWKSDLNYHTCGAFSPLTMTMMHDKLSRPYLYIANKEGGMKVYDISAVAAPSLVATLPITMYGSMEVMNLTQEGNYVYLALGNNFDTLAPQGMAIVDVTNPTNPSVTDYYQVPNGKGGAGALAVEGNYAYLCAMGTGLVILDVTNKSNIQFVSKFKPNINYPPVSNPDPKKINLRSVEVKNSIAYACYDAGGLRIINCTNKNSPKETGRYCNPAMYTPFDHPKAYNNIVLDDTLIYAAVDYAGMEVLNISDTGNIKMVGWWNPLNAPNANWFGARIHANEIKLEKNCNRIFISDGKSDMHVIDVSNPSQPDSCNFYGGTGNGIGTWGLNISQNQIYLSYICTLGVPFPSNFTGVKLLTYNPCTVGIQELDQDDISIFPSPARDKITIASQRVLNFGNIKILNLLGQIILSSTEKEINISGINPGLYFLQVPMNGQIITKKFVKE